MPRKFVTKHQHLLMVFHGTFTFIKSRSNDYNALEKFRIELQKAAENAVRLKGQTKARYRIYSLTKAED